MQDIQTEIVVLGGGPGGYAAAFYASDLNKKVTLIDVGDRLGGVCLNRGCIPSKALLHVAKLLQETREAENWGVKFGKHQLDLARLREWKNASINKLSSGIKSLALQRGVQTLQGRGRFEAAGTIRVETADGQKIVKYEKAIIAVGSLPALPSSFDLGNKRIMTSTEALEMEEIPKRLLVVGGGYIGMELGTVYGTFGSEVVLIEALDQILSGIDADLVKLVTRRASKLFSAMRLQTKVLSMSTSGKQIKVVLEDNDGKHEELYDRVLVSVGRKPNCYDLGLENTSVATDAKGFVMVNDNLQTGDPNIYAIGDVIGGALLAHKASKEARIAVENMTGKIVDAQKAVMPAVVFTDPEVAWCGMTEAQARENNMDVKISKFPWSASGRALSLGRTDGLTKLVIEPETDRILGVGIAGPGAGELISEGVLAIEMGATTLDLASTVHPHPTLSESLMECAEAYYGHSTHTLPKK